MTSLYYVILKNVVLIFNIIFIYLIIQPLRGLEAQESILTTATDISFQENLDLSDQEK